MEFLNKILGVATGGLAKEVFDAVKVYFPPDMPPEQVAQLQLATERLEMERERNTDAAIAGASQAINERVAQLEGTASDLKTIPYFGTLMLFLRGSQRPVWGYATLYMDWMWFSDPAWQALSQQQEGALYIVNFLVLGFLFGERAVQNVAPFIADVFRARAGSISPP